jgi:hypothetical protein
LALRFAAAPGAAGAGMLQEEGHTMAKGQMRKNKEAKKPKKEKPKVLVTSGLASTVAATKKK